MSADGSGSRTVTKRLVMPVAYDLQIQRVAIETGIEPGEVLRRAVDLLLLALDRKKQGKRLIFVGPNQEVEPEVVGL
jgi:hypothetical protein